VIAVEPTDGIARARRMAFTAGLVFVPMFLIASLLQLRPFIWDTVHPRRSLLAFQHSKNPMQLGAWSRITLLIPLVFLATTLWALLEERDPLRVRAGSFMLGATGILGVVSGIAQSTVGVFAEDYLPTDPGVRAHALSADALFWIHDNLATLSLIALSVAAVTLARPMRKAGFPAWTLWAGSLALPFSAAMAILFTLRSSRKGSLLYRVPWAGAVFLITVWVVGIIVACRRSPRRNARQTAP
jgi:hypothetical protein